MVEPVGQRPVVAGDAEEAETDDEQSRDGARAERNVEGRLQPSFRRLGGAHVGPDGDVHADEPRGGRQDRPDEEADGGAPAQLVVEAEQEKRRDRHEPDRRVLPAQVRLSTFLHGARDLLHSLGSRGLPDHPGGQHDTEGDANARADQRKQHRMVDEEVHLRSLSAHKVGAEWLRRAKACLTSARAYPITRTPRAAHWRSRRPAAGRSSESLRRGGRGAARCSPGTRSSPRRR